MKEEKTTKTTTSSSSTKDRKQEKKGFPEIMEAHRSDPFPSSSGKAAAAAAAVVEEVRNLERPMNPFLHSDDEEGGEPKKVNRNDKATKKKLLSKVQKQPLAKGNEKSKKYCEEREGMGNDEEGSKGNMGDGGTLEIVTNALERASSGGIKEDFQGMMPGAFAVSASAEASSGEVQFLDEEFALELAQEEHAQSERSAKTESQRTLFEAEAIPVDPAETVIYATTVPVKDKDHHNDDDILCTCRASRLCKIGTLALIFLATLVILAISLALTMTNRNNAATAADDSQQQLPHLPHPTATPSFSPTPRQPYELPYMRRIPNTYCQYYQAGGDGPCSVANSFQHAWLNCDRDGSQKCMGIMWNPCEDPTSNTHVNGAWKLMTSGQTIGDENNPTETCGGASQALGHWDVYVRVYRAPHVFCDFYDFDDSCAANQSFDQAWQRCDYHGSDVCMGILWKPCHGSQTDTSGAGSWRLLTAGQQPGVEPGSSSVCSTSQEEGIDDREGDGEEDVLASNVGVWYSFLRNENDALVALATTASPTIAPTHARTLTRTLSPTVAPSLTPTLVPSLTPTHVPSLTPTLAPSKFPSMSPSTSNPNTLPGQEPTNWPTSMTLEPTKKSPVPSAPTSSPDTIKTEPTPAPAPAKPNATPKPAPSEPISTLSPTTTFRAPTSNPISSFTSAPTTSHPTSSPTHPPTTGLPTSSTPSEMPTSAPAASPEYDLPPMRHVPNVYCNYIASGGDGSCEEGISFEEAWAMCDRAGVDRCMGVMWNSCKGPTSDTTVHGAWKLMTAGQDIGDANNPTPDCGGADVAAGHWDAFVRVYHVPNAYCEYYEEGGDGNCDAGISFFDVWAMCDADGSSKCMGIMWNPCDEEGPTSSTNVNGGWKLVNAGQEIGDAIKPSATCESGFGHWDIFLREDRVPSVEMPENYVVPPNRHVPDRYCDSFVEGGDGSCEEGISFEEAWYNCDRAGVDRCMGIMWNSCEGPTSNTTVNGAWKLMTAGQDEESGCEDGLGHWDLFIRL